MVAKTRAKADKIFLVLISDCREVSSPFLNALIIGTWYLAEKFKRHHENYSRSVIIE